VLELNQEILLALRCPRCETEEAVYAAAWFGFGTCGGLSRCRAERGAVKVSAIEGGEAFLARSFAGIGVPLFDIVAGRVGLTRVGFEFSADGPVPWPVVAFRRVRRRRHILKQEAANLKKESIIDVSQIDLRGLSERGFPSESGFRVCIARAAHETIWKHARESVAAAGAEAVIVEVGGVLVGHVYKDEDGPFFGGERGNCCRAHEQPGHTDDLHS